MAPDTQNRPRIQLMDPRGESPKVGVQTAPRPESLEGRVLGLVDNTKINARKLLDQLADLLKTEGKPKEVVLFTKPDATRPAPKDLIQQIAEKCDVAVLAVGD